MEAAPRRVLIVTRERLLGDLLVEALSARHYVCGTETSPTQALEHAARDRQLLTMVDVASLRHEGLDLIADLRLTNPDAAVVAIVGRGTAADETSVYGLGVTDIVRRDEDLRHMLGIVGHAEDESPAEAPTEARERPLAEPLTLDEPATVLVVDDDASVRQLLERVLTRNGYRVLTAADGVEALHHLDREEIHLMFLDLRMPRLGGLAVLRRLREHASRPRTVIVSGLSDRDLKAETIGLGAFDYLEKPVSVDRLLVTASAAMVLELSRSQSRWNRWSRRPR